MANEKEILGEEDKKFIIDNYQKMSVYQMAIRLNVITENRKCPVIAEFIRNSNLQPSDGAPVVADVKPVEVTTESVVQAILDEKNINPEAPDTDRAYETISIEEFATVLRDLHITVRTPISEKEKKDIAFLLNQMESRRFLYNYRTYHKKEYKELFKEEFIRALYGKGEMPQEEVNDFIDVCNETVLEYDIKCKIREIEKQRTKDGISDARATALDNLVINLNESYSASVKRASEIKKTLGANREQRLKDSRPTGMTVMALIEAFYDEEKRTAMLKIQESKDKDIMQTLNLLSEMDEIQALILGISPEELLRGGL